MPQWLLDKLRTPPKAGSGIHGWLFSCARQLHAHLTPEQAFEALKISAMRCDRRVSDREIRDAVQNSIGVAWEARETHQYDPDVVAPQGEKPPVERWVRTMEPWPKRHDPTRAMALADARSKVSTLADLWESSPIDPEGYSADDWIDVLFPGNPWLCVAHRHPRDSETVRRSKLTWRCSSMSFIVPNAMTKALGARKDGRPSPRCLANTGPRQYLVVEFDDGDGQDTHAALHWTLNQTSLATGGPPLVLAVWSGGKSLHGWYRVGEIEEEPLKDWMSYAVQLGADPATWTKCQLVRMPAGVRDNGNYQTVCYANL
jgi:hypothetical protein